MQVMTKEDQKSRKSPYLCPKCEHPSSRAQHNNLVKGYLETCHNCLEMFDVETAKLALRAASVKFLDTEEVFNNFWWHTTNRVNWFSDIRSYAGSDRGLTPMVHVGTFNAACDRGRWEGYSSIFRVKLKNSASICPNILDDQTSWKELASVYRHDVIRYLNRWESAGSISLLVNPNAIVFAEKRPYPAIARKQK